MYPPSIVASIGNSEIKFGRRGQVGNDPIARAVKKYLKTPDIRSALQMKRFPRIAVTPVWEGKEPKGVLVRVGKAKYHTTEESLINFMFRHDNNQEVKPLTCILTKV